MKFITPLMHGHEPVFTIPGWFDLLILGIMLYFLVAMLAGCPYCMLPNLRWPLDLVQAAVQRVMPG